MRIDLLETLRQHMKSDKRGLDKFYFGKIFNEHRTPVTSSCTTSGCMAGELPYAFPEAWSWPARHACPDIIIPILHGHDQRGLMYMLAEFFELSAAQVEHIFFPEEQNTEAYGGEELHGSSPLEDVVSNLDIFINKAIAGEILANT